MIRFDPLRTMCRLVVVGSLTVTVKLQVLALPQASVAVQFTVVVPSAKVEPEAGTQTTATALQVSLAVVVKVTTAPLALVQLLVRFGEQRMDGAVISTT